MKEYKLIKVSPTLHQYLKLTAFKKDITIIKLINKIESKIMEIKIK